MAAGPGSTMWFGVSGGAIRYDGLTWTEFGEESGLPSMVEAFAAVGERMFAATRYSIYVLEKPLSTSPRWEPFYPVSQNWPWHFWHLSAASNGDLWAATTWGVLRLPTNSHPTANADRRPATLYTSEQTATTISEGGLLPNLKTSVVDAINWSPITKGCGIHLNGSSRIGRCIVALTEGGPAARAGLRIGDKIVGINGKPRSNVRQTEMYAPAGTRMTFTVRRPGVDHLVTVELECVNNPGRLQAFRPFKTVEDATGVIWVATTSGRIFSLQQGEHGQANWTNHTQNENLPRVPNPQLTTTSGGIAVVGGREVSRHILQFDGESWTRTSLSRWLNSSILSTDTGEILVGGSGVVMSVVNGVETRFSTSEGGIFDNAVMLEKAPDGAIWVGGRDSIALRVEPQNARWTSYKGINFLCSAPNGDEWFLSETLQVIRHSRESWQAFDETDGLMSLPLAVIATKSGEVWAAGSHKGIAATAILRNSTWERKLHPELSWSVDRRSLFEDRDGRIWLGAASGYPSGSEFEGGTLRFDGRNWKHFVSKRAMLFVDGFCQTADGSIWIRGSNLAQIGPDDSIRALDHLPARARGFCLALAADLSDGLWISKNRFGVVHIQKPWRHPAESSDFEARYENGFRRATWYDETDGIATNRLQNIVPMQDGSLLVSSHAGFNTFHKNAWGSSSLPDSLADRVHSGALKVDEENAVWVNFSRLGDIDREQAISGKLNLPEEEPFSTIRYLPDGDAPETRVANSVSEFQESAEAAISFNGVDRWNLTQPERLMYSWTIDEGPWTQFSTNTLARLTSVPAGTHVFRVRARDTDLNVDLSPASLTFEVVPPVWRRNWFRLLILLAFALIAITLTQSIRVIHQEASLKATNGMLVVAERKLQRSNVDLEGRVLERTAELQAVNEQLQREIYDRKAIEQRLLESELQYRSIVEDQTEMVIRFKTDGTLTFANEAYCKNNDLTPEAIKDFNCFSIVHPDDRERVVQIVRSTSAEAPFAMDVMRIVRADGTVDWAEWRGRALYDDRGRHYGYQAVGRVVTDLVDAQKKLKESELRYRSIVEDQREMIIRFDQAGVITFANDAYARSRNCSQHEIVGRSCFERIHPDDVQAAKDLMAKTNQDNPFAFMRMRVVQDDGTVRWGEWNGRALYDDHDQLLGYQAIGRDVTELQEARDRLRQKEHELAHLARVSALGEMVAGISHEINQPLATIANFSAASQLVLEKDAISPEDRAKLQTWAIRVSRQTDRINNIVQRLRRFGRPGSHRQKFAINDAISEALLVTETRTRDTVDELVVDCPGDLPPIYADRIQIEQVLVNLIRNACDAMNEMPQGQRRLCIEVRQAEGQLILRVTDSGIGVAPEQANDVFDMFVTSKSEGMGMGLAISRSIIEAHSGKILCRTTDFGGQFEFSLPIGEHKGNEQ